MSSCPNCKGFDIEYDSTQGNSICIRCGTVVEENAVVAEVTFAELANGTSSIEGQFVSAERGKSAIPSINGRHLGEVSISNKSRGTLEAGDSLDPSQLAIVGAESREMTLLNGRRRLQALAGAVGLSGEHYLEIGHRWYSLALQHQFTRGRRGPNVIAACLYIVCRQERTPHMLLDFADVLSTSVYSLGGTFLRLVRLLNLEIPIIDPSFFVARFAARLEFGEKTAQVANTALRLVARMKRDWIQVGRRPAGVCAAGLTIAARMHGFRRTEAEIVKVVRICEATLKKRLDEFGQTPSSQLSPQEFEGIWLESEADPPSFTHIRSKSTVHNEGVYLTPARAAIGANPIENRDPLTPPASIGDILEDNDTNMMALVMKPFQKNIENVENLSDIDIDDEIQEILLGEEEINLKTQLWTEMNKDYLEKEAEKARIKAIEEAEKEATKIEKKHKVVDENFQEGHDDNILSASEDTEEYKIGKKRRQSTRKSTTTMTSCFKKEKSKTNDDHSSSTSTNTVVAKSAAEAARNIIQSKQRLSKKINYEALDELFSSTAASVIGESASVESGKGDALR